MLDLFTGNDCHFQNVFTHIMNIHILLERQSPNPFNKFEAKIFTILVKPDE